MTINLLILLVASLVGCLIVAAILAVVIVGLVAARPRQPESRKA